MQKIDYEIVHQAPVWRDRANFIIAALIEEDGEVTREQLWARQLPDSQFEICCIPFVLRNVALGDVVSTDASYYFAGVSQRSGRFVLRAWLHEGTWSSRPDIRSPIVQRGGIVEHSSPRLIAIDASDQQMAEDISGFLYGLEGKGVLTYETGS